MDTKRRKDDIEVKLINQEVKIMKEQNDKDHKEIKSEVRSIKDELVCELKELKNALSIFMRTVDETKADKSEVKDLKRTLWFVVSVSVGFLIWALQSLLNQLLNK